MKKLQLTVTYQFFAIAFIFFLITPASAATLSIKTTTLPSCVAKAPCAMVLVGAGGNRDDLYEWSIASGGLPTGMKLDRFLGAIYTTIDAQTAAGNYTFTVKIQDDSGATAVRTFTLAVTTNPATGVAVSTPQKLKSNTTYVVQKDMYCAETCFAFDGNSVTLDCNGHKLVYNTSGTAGNYGVAAVADWDSLTRIDSSWSTTSGTGANLTIKNCRIEESDSSVAKSHGIRIGQVNGSGVTILNTQVITKKQNSEPFYGSFSQKHTFKQNIFYNRAPSPISRQNLEGVSVRRYGSMTSQPNLFEDNVLLDSPQGGIIFASSPATVIRRNAIRLSDVASNAFAIYAWSEGQQIYDNTIDNYADDLLLDTIKTAGGRGFQVDGGNLSGTPIQIYNNMVRVREVNRNVEYKGCVLGGAYGIQYEKNARNSHVHDNTLIAVAKECNATAVKVTSSSTASTTNYQNLVYNNVLSAQRIGTTGNWAVGVNDAYGQWLTLSANRFVVDTAVMGATFDSSVGNMFFSGSTIVKGKNPSSKWALWGDVGACQPKVDTHSFVDLSYQNGASEISSYPAWNHSCGGTADYKKYRYRVGWSYQLTLTKGGVALPGATVTVKNNAGTVTFSGTTDSTGKVLASIFGKKVENTNTSARVETKYTNTVTISKSGCTTQSFSMNPTAPVKETRSMTCQ